MLYSTLSFDDFEKFTDNSIIKLVKYIDQY